MTVEIANPRDSADRQPKAWATDPEFIHFLADQIERKRPAQDLPSWWWRKDGSILPACKEHHDKFKEPFERDRVVVSKDAGYGPRHGIAMSHLNAENQTAFYQWVFHTKKPNKRADALKRMYHKFSDRPTYYYQSGRWTNVVVLEVPTGRIVYGLNPGTDHIYTCMNEFIELPAEASSLPINADSISSRLYMQPAPSLREYFLTLGNAAQKELVDYNRKLAQKNEPLLPGVPLPLYAYHNVCTNAAVEAEKNHTSDREMVLAALTKHGYTLQYAPRELKGDHEIVLAAVQQHGCAIQFATSELKDNPEIAMAAVQNWGDALQYVGPKLQADPTIVMAAIVPATDFGEVKVQGRALRYAHESLKASREFALRAMEKSDKSAFECLHKSLQKDRDVVLAAVKSGYADTTTLRKFHSDREIMLAATKRHGNGKLRCLSSIKDPFLKHLCGLPTHRERREAQLRVVVLCLLFKLRLRRQQEAARHAMFEADYNKALAAGRVRRMDSFLIGWEAGLTTGYKYIPHLIGTPAMSSNRRDEELEADFAEAKEQGLREDEKGDFFVGWEAAFRGGWRHVQSARKRKREWKLE